MRGAARYYPALIERGFTDHRGKPLASAFQSRGGYNGGSRSYRLSGWTPSLSGPNQAYWGDFATLVSRSRDAVRNNPYARKAVHSFVANAVGTGIIPRWRRLRKHLVKNLGYSDEQAREYTAQLVDLWDEWSEHADADGVLDIYGLQALGMQTMLASGEAIARVRTRRMSDRLPVPMQIQALEPDYLDSTKHGDATEGGRRVMRRLGVEFDAIGRRRAYWLRRMHPGDDVWMGGSLDSHRVPASEVLHLYRVDRPGQVRGIPWLAPVIARLHSLNEFEDATCTSQKIQAMFAAFITRDPATADGTPPTGWANDNAHAQALADAGEVLLEPGAISELAPGEKIEFSEPKGVAGSFEPFVQHQLRAIAAGIGITYEQLTGDLRRVNYSSIRAGLVEFRRYCQSVQYLTIVRQFCRPVMDAWLRHVHASGAMDLPGYADDPRPYHAVDWRPPGWDWVDPKKDIEAKILAWKHGFESRTGIIAEQGYDREDVDAELAEEREDARRMGLVFPDDVQIPPSNDDEDDDSDNTQSDDE